MQLGREIYPAWQKNPNPPDFTCSSLSLFPLSCLRNEVEIAVAMSLWRDLTGEQGSEACLSE